ncbi:Helicase protein MOM1 [Platanthera zijinensis]|uniref:Helicase protein MOM1 n=1 Tax=Platanthera zijinensis TaxID=2320716 RepID=A0AAP0BNA8_9ASPA
MASGTRLARLKKLEDVNASKNKSRKLGKVPDKSSLNKKLEITEKIQESPLKKSVRAEIIESLTSANSKKHARPIVYKSRKEDGSIGPSSNSDKANKGASQPTKKRKEDGRGVSSSTENSTVSARPQKKNRNGEAKNIDLGANATKSEDNGKKTIRKHFHVGTYRKFVRRQASKCGNQGPDISKEKDDRDQDNKRCDALDKEDSVAETIKPLDKEDLKKTEQLTSDLDSASRCDGVYEDNETKFSVSKNRKRILSDILKEPSGKKTPGQDQCAVNIESPTSIREEEPGASVSGAHYEACPEGNRNIDSEQCTTHSQTASDLISNTCLVCKQPGQLMCCFGKGCQRSYHLSCLEPFFPGAWLCNFCVKRKVDSVYSVFEGIESVWDIDEGVQSGKHYFVKYKGLSHAHNRWISESQVLHDAPSLLAKFRKKYLREKVTKWNRKWTEPERLLHKRLVVLPESSDECTSGSVTESSNCCTEWFVKWKGLDYDQATWELQNSPVLCSSDAAKLIENYELRCELARRNSDPQRVEMALRIKKEPFFRLTGLPDGCPSVLSDDLLGSLNCLREFWHRSVNAVLIDDQERLTKSIVFLLSLQCHACRPSLIITTSGSLPLWHAEFVRLAPYLNVVMYQGDKDVRKMIMNLEFYEESGSLMFQVLLAENCALMEDFRDITCIGWEAVVIDKCEKSKISRYLEQLRSLNTYFKLLLFNGQLKDNISEYHFLLSLLGTGGTSDNGFTSLKADTKEALGALATVKEKLARHIAYECKADSSSFVEYWVPAPFSNVQLEQFCSTFISNSSVLRSNSRSDVVGALHNILITSRKCCDHPYLVDGELRGLLTKGLQATDFLNAEVRASGKLFLLDKILQEMRSRELRVVILFQSLGGHGKISLGDILDDFLQQRFGVDSYERIESGLVRTKKLASLNMFNSKEGENKY